MHPTKSADGKLSDDPRPNRVEGTSGVSPSSARTHDRSPAAWVKIFGERNTGTNALKRIIEQNSASRCLPSTALELDPFAMRRVRLALTPLARERRTDAIFARRGPLEAWKHCATNFVDVSAFAGVLVLFTVRHPASWLVSFFKRPYHQLGWRPRDLEKFSEISWRTVERERLGGASLRPLELYQRKLESYLEFAERLSRYRIQHQFVRFEDLILHQADVFTGIAGDLLDPSPRFHELRESTKDKAKQLEDYQRYYGEERWREVIGDNLQQMVSAQIEWSNFGQFGYAATVLSSKGEPLCH